MGWSLNVFTWIYINIKLFLIMGKTTSRMNAYTWKRLLIAKTGKLL